jgi:hypothetical protein
MRREVVFTIGLMMGGALTIPAATARAATPAQAEVIDRIVAVVNRTPILASDCDEELRFEAFLDRRAPDSARPARDAALERLIDQALIEQQMTASRYVPAGDPETQAAVEQVKQQIAPDEQQWAAALLRYGLTQAAVSAHLRRQVNQLRYIELRFHSEALPTADAVQRYYNDQYMARVRTAGGKPQMLADVREQIEQILTEQRVNELMTTWLQTLRSQADINRRQAASAGQ